MDLKTLEKMNVAQLREEAAKVPDLAGARGMSKDQLVCAIAAANGVDLSARRRGGGTQADLKRQIRETRTSIGEAIAAKDSGRTKELRRRVRRLKAKTRRAAERRKSAAAAAAPAAS